MTSCSRVLIVLIVNFEHISHFCLVFEFLILSIYLLTGTERDDMCCNLQEPSLQGATNQKMRKSYFITSLLCLICIISRVAITFPFVWIK